MKQFQIYFKSNFMQLKPFFTGLLLILFYPGLKAQDPNPCGIPCTSQTSSTYAPYVEFYDAPNKPYFVRLYLRFIQPVSDPNAFDESFDARATRIWNNLREAYAPQNIFFVPGFDPCEGAASYMVITNDILPVQNGSNAPFESWRVGSTNGVPNFNSDGINVYIFKDDLSTGDPGNSFCIPNNYCYVYGASPDNGPASKTHLVAHEVGHCLGLLHTFEGNSNGCLDVDGSDCQHKGDFVCDTPPDNGNYGANTTCTPGSPLAMDYSNIMSYYLPYVCRNHFTNGQGERMRYYIKNGFGVLNQVKASDVVITAFTEWTTPVDVPANIIIEPGGALLIKSIVRMREGAMIYVKASTTSGVVGGRLRIYKLVTAACPGKLWKGIIVDGRTDIAQPSDRQASVTVLQGGIIEHARCGARLSGLDETDEASRGGYITSFGGEFRNNIQDVNILPYASKPNKSYFLSSKFTTGNNYRGNTAEIPLHVRIDGVTNVKFSNCQFKDLRTDTYNDPATRGTGLVASSSSFSLSGNSPFQNLFEGCHISSISALANDAIIGATFDGCFTGIFSHENNNYSFNGNTFNLHRPTNYSGNPNTKIRGIHMEGLGSTGFSVNGNHFLNSSNTNTDNFVGTESFSFGTMNRSIANNDYYLLKTGNHSAGENGIKMNELIFQGLMYECNQHESADAIDKDNWVSGGQIRFVQGQSDQFGNKISTGNKYNEQLSIPPVGQQFVNQGVVGISYHHRLGTSEELITGHYSDNTIQPVQGFLNLNCGTIECPNPPCPEPNLTSLNAQFFQDKQTWITKTAGFPAITNSVQKITEANAINNLRNSLDRAGSRILLYYSLDTTEVKTDSILVWLGNLSTYDADLGLARYNFFKGNYTQCDYLLQIIPSRYSLTGNLLSEFNDFKALLLLIKPILQSGKKPENLPSALLQTLQNDWSGGCSIAGALARNILFQNGIRIEVDCAGEEQRPAHSDNPKSSLSPDAPFSIYPNPAGEMLVLERSNSDSEAIIRLVDLSNGRTALEQRNTAGEAVTSINTSGLHGGIYSVLILDNFSLFQEQKIVILH